MIHYELLSDQSILLVTPEGALDSADFEKLAGEIDPIIEKKGGLSGMMIYVKSFPGWKDFAAFLAHLKFVKNHHREIKKIAAVTDAGILAILPSIANHFVQAEVKHFDYADKEKALRWLGS
jgi:tRNA U38,U39,U40 pseudouridine synthase TruA